MPGNTTIAVEVITRDTTVAFAQSFDDLIVSESYGLLFHLLLSLNAKLKLLSERTSFFRSFILLKDKRARKMKYYH